MYAPRVRLVGNGPLLVLVPGMDGTGELFYRQVPLLARRYRVATYALREQAGMDDLIADLAGIIASASPGAGATVVGESFGGAVALSFAVAHPEMLDRLVVLNSFPRFRPQAQLQLAIGVLGALPFPWSVMSLVRRLTAFRLHSRHTHARDVRRFLELTAGTTREGYLHRLRVLLRYDIRDRLREIQAPTLFLASDRDHLVPAVAQARYMVERVPHATLRVLEGHGHICLIAPDLDLAAILAEWIA